MRHWKHLKNGDITGKSRSVSSRLVAKPLQFQLGTEYARQALRTSRGAPFVALNLEIRQEVDFSPGVSILTGWQWRNPETLKAFRVGMQYFNVPSNQYEFYQDHNAQLGIGVWYDF